MDLVTVEHLNDLSISEVLDMLKIERQIHTRGEHTFFSFFIFYIMCDSCCCVSCRGVVFQKGKYI